MSGVRYTWKTFGHELVVLAVAAVWWIPFYLLVVTSFKGASALESGPFALPRPLTTDNYQTAWQGASVTLGHGLLNSLIITVGSVLLILVFSSLCAYTIARRDGSAGQALYVLFLLGIVLPFQLGVAPMFMALHQLGIAGSYLGMMLLYAALLMPLGVFLYTGFVRALPRDYEEAAAVDGARRSRIFLRVVFPLLLPVTGTVAVLTAMFVWNDFFTQLVILGGSEHETLPVAIYSFVGQFTTEWSVIFAAVVVSVVPMLGFYWVAQRSLIRGFTGGIRG